MKKALLAQCLTYAGVLPFLCAAIIPAVKPNFLGLNYDNIILTYGAVIVSFVAGVHWGIYLFKDPPLNLFIHSNIAALLAWSAVLVAHPGSAFILLLCFLMSYALLPPPRAPRARFARNFHRLLLS